MAKAPSPSSSEEEDREIREELSKLIVSTLTKIIERAIEEKTPLERARIQAGKKAQSLQSEAQSRILHSTLTENKKSPVRPRDFRASLGDAANIGRSELSDILARMVRLRILDNKREEFPYPRGRPKNEGVNEFSDERRGLPSYYQESDVKRLVDQILSNEEAVNSIYRQLVQSGIWLKFRTYATAVFLFQSRFDKESVFKTYRERGITKERADQNSKNITDKKVLIKDLSDERIEEYAKAYAIKTISDESNNIEKSGSSSQIILLKIAAILGIIGAYED